MTAVEEEVLGQHALEAGFLWELRDAATRDPAYDLGGLGHLDERIEAHLDGLRLAGDKGWAKARAALDDGEAGEVFAASVLALEHRDLRRLALIIDVAGDSPALARGLVSALGWVSFDHVRVILPGLLDTRCPAALHYLGIAACAVHRQDPGAPLGYAVLSTNARLQGRALRTAGEIGRSDLLPEVRAALSAEDASCRFWASWSAAIFGDPASATPLWAFASAGGPRGVRASRITMRRMGPEASVSWLQALAAQPAATGAALEGARALGDPVLMPWILEAMRNPATARVAGAAFTMITGADLADLKLAQKAPAGFVAGPSEEPGSDDVAMDPEESLSWPDPGAVERWWGPRARDFKRGTRYLLGKPMADPGWLERVLRESHQPARAAVAEELSIRHPARALFEVRAPASRQRRDLASG